MTLTPKQLETLMARELRSVRREDLPTLSEANRAYAEIRERLGFAPVPGLFLSDETDIGKLTAGTGRHAVALSLPPASSSGVANTCAFSDHCEIHCVGTGGSNRYESTARGKTARLLLWIESPRAALTLLVSGLEKISQQYGQENMGMRLNTYSDIRWERILPAWFWETFADVVFYDYTKHSLSSRPEETLPRNYRVTYSVSPRSTMREISAQRDAGRSVAVVVTTRGGKDRGTGTYRSLPVAADDVVTVDGDADDRRYNDPAGSVVMLRRKNRLAETDPLVVSDSRLMGILGRQ